MTPTATTKAQSPVTGFTPINRGYDQTFRPGKMSIVLVVPLETYDWNPVPTTIPRPSRIRFTSGFISE